MPYFFTYNEAIWLLIPHYDFSHYTQDFFQQGKTYLLNMFKAGYFTQRFLLNEYFYGLPATKNQVVDWCQSFSWQEFQQEILNPLINIKKQDEIQIFYFVFYKNMAKKVLFVVANVGFQDYEFGVPYQAVKKAGYEVSIASGRGGVCRGAFMKRIDESLKLSEVVVQEYDLVVFVGGG